MAASKRIYVALTVENLKGTSTVVSPASFGGGGGKGEGEYLGGGVKKIHVKLVNICYFCFFCAEDQIWSSFNTFVIIFWETRMQEFLLLLLLLKMPPCLSLAPPLYLQTFCKVIPACSNQYLASL